MPLSSMFEAMMLICFGFSWPFAIIKTVKVKISAEKAQALFAGKTLRVVCDGIDYERSCFVGRTYFQAYGVDGVTYFTAPHAATGEVYDVCVERTENGDLIGAFKE